MRIACDVCQTAAAAVICCADEAALCARCDEDVHAANKLAGKHRRLPLRNEAAKLPRCDICQDKSAFIFCVEDRALFCQDCDEVIHIAATLSANHQRLLATGICVGFSSPQNLNLNPNNHHLQPPNSIAPASKVPAVMQTPSPPIPSSWAIDDFLQLSESHEKESLVGLGDLSWFDEEGSIDAAEVPEMFFGYSSNESLQRSLKSKSNMPSKKPRIQILDDEDFLTVPDIG